MLNLVRDLTWPDFEVYVDCSLITLKRIKEKHFPRRITMDWNRFVDWWETLGSYPPPGTSFETCSEEVAQEIVAKWNGIAKKVNKEFLKTISELKNSSKAAIYLPRNFRCGSGNVRRLQLCSFNFVKLVGEKNPNNIGRNLAM